MNSIALAAITFVLVLLGPPRVLTFVVAGLARHVIFSFG